MFIHREEVYNFYPIAFFRNLDQNPLTTVEDPYLFNLPALKYL